MGPSANGPQSPPLPQGIHYPGNLELRLLPAYRRRAVGKMGDGGWVGARAELLWERGSEEGRGGGGAIIILHVVNLRRNGTLNVHSP